MNAAERSTGSSEPTRARPRAAPPTVPSATRPARGRRGCSSRRSLDRDLLSLLSQSHSTVPPSPRRSEVRYESATYGSIPPPPTWRQRGVKQPPAINRRLVLFRVFGLYMGKIESRRADSNRLPLLITSVRSVVAGGCRGVQIPHK